jgi:peptidylprolyl isomerase
MTTAAKGSEVTVHYTGTLDDKSVFDTSEDRDPLSFTIGDGNLIAGFENAMLGMKKGETKTIALPPEEAYGPYRDELVIQVERNELPIEDPEVGAILQSSVQGEVVHFTIVEMDNTHVTLDANHPLAGETLHFEITVVKVTPGESEE